MAVVGEGEVDGGVREVGQVGEGAGAACGQRDGSRRQGSERDSSRE